MSGERPSAGVEAHPFEASSADPERCALCGELQVQIRHHPTRIRAARLLREAGAGSRGERREP